MDIPPLSIELRARVSITAPERQAIDLVDHAAFAGQDGHGYAWSDSDWILIGARAGEIVAVTGLVDRMASVGSQPVRLAGVGGVAVLPRWQGLGYGRQIIQAANRAIRETLQPDFGLLLCGESMVPFYARLGWQETDAPLWFDQPGGRKLRWQERAMIYPARKIAWPEGDIDLGGLPW